MYRRKFNSNSKVEDLKMTRTELLLAMSKREKITEDEILLTALYKKVENTYNILFVLENVQDELSEEELKLFGALLHEITKKLRLALES